jgi:hypothetical protein
MVSEVFFQYGGEEMESAYDILFPLFQARLKNLNELENILGNIDRPRSSMPLGTEKMPFVAASHGVDGFVEYFVILTIKNGVIDFKFSFERPQTESRLTRYQDVRDNLIGLRFRLAENICVFDRFTQRTFDRIIDAFEIVDIGVDLGSNRNGVINERQAVSFYILKQVGSDFRTERTAAEQHCDEQ